MQDKTEYLEILLNLQEASYKNTLALVGIIELLLEKNIISQEELSSKTAAIHEFAFDVPAGKTTSAPAL